MGVPYCIIAQISFGSHLRTMRVPESWIPRVTAYGWQVLIRDSEMPSLGLTFSWRDLHGNPQRSHWYDSEAMHDQVDGSD